MRGTGSTRRLALRVGAALTLAALAILAACPEGGAPDDPRPLVVVSVLPQQYAVERIAGDLVRVEVMIPPGANPASYEPTFAQLSALRDAAFYVKVGHPHFPFEETWLDRILAEAPDLRIVDSMAGVESREEDPHIWLAPRHVEKLAVQVEAALGESLPGQRPMLQTNLAAFRAEIDALDAELRSLLSPLQGRDFLVLHPAWHYFAEAYGLRQVAIEREHKDPDPHELAELIEYAREAGLAVIFVQPQFDSSSAEVLAREIGARVELLDPLARDWPANLRRVARALAGAWSE